jgi:FlaA1/EpsC-like NDP-sugar epimerase
MEQVFSEYNPHVVFHAAAHKHVPIMEDNVAEAVQNNVFGTQCIAEMCGRFGVDRMVLISTDKAVYPSSVMGATKWLSEEVERALSSLYPKTTYLTVRFGNVLGSRGSVIPIFREQIQHGGPVTITHPEMTRYFMTIPEAVQLVLQAGAIGLSDELFLLDMGEPIKIVDLAYDMIRLSGLEPEVDIPIIFTGLRPGEKLHEQLVMDGAIIEPGPCEGLSIIRRQHNFSSKEFEDIMQHLQQLVGKGDSTAILAYFEKVVPSFINTPISV